VPGTPAQGLEDEGVESAVEAVFGLGGHGVIPRCLCLTQTAEATPRCQGMLGRSESGRLHTPGPRANLGADRLGAGVRTLLVGSQR
jgi:hypothetical protein